MGYRISATLTGETHSSYQLLLDWATSGEGNEYETVLLPKSAIIETYLLEPIIKRGDLYGHDQHQFYEDEFHECFRAVYPIWGFIDVEISTFIANNWGLSEKGYKKPCLERKSHTRLKHLDGQRSDSRPQKASKNRMPLRPERKQQHRHSFSEDMQI